ncbi:type II toxin-antitoxin system RelE/ParE family toxin [Telmatospirillum sp.]|uniref:type II toxin-antitoxin system RelE/ParE family toxin n=1 Tax=Telmatospirillum sp. TaxID=2079197 RepID=UPI00284C02AD|nr:type II toxin-antitoxin system RelE/ParE family toxin [Telmatospirillum sp.]
MIKTCGDKRTTRFWAGERVKEFESFMRQAQRRLTYLNEANQLADLRALPSNRFEALGGDRAHQYSIRIDDQWRVCFRWELRQPLAEGIDILIAEGDAIDVEIVDYH